jgi:predicted phage tail protein
MKVKVFENVNEFFELDLQISSVREAISGIRLHKGKEFAERVAGGKYKYILIPENESEKPIALLPDVIFSEVNGFKELIIFKDVEGEVKAAMIAPIIAGAGATMATVTVGQAILIYTVTAIVNMAISMALNMVMSLISPTKEFSSDPSSAQRNNSNLFNGAPLIREQGGSVPLAFGYGFAGGVLISSSLTTTEG